MHQYQHCTAHWYGASSMHASSWMHGVQSWIWNVAQQFLYTHLPADIQTLRNTTLLHMIYFVVVNCKYTLHAVGRYGDTRTALMETIDDERSWGHRSIWVHGLDGFWWIQVHAGRQAWISMRIPCSAGGRQGPVAANDWGGGCCPAGRPPRLPAGFVHVPPADRPLIFINGPNRAEKNEQSRTVLWYYSAIRGSRDWKSTVQSTNMHVLSQYTLHSRTLSLTQLDRSALAAYYHDAATQSHQHRSTNFHFSLWLASAEKNTGTRERLERHMHVYGTIDRLGICLLTDQWPAETSQLNSPGRSTNRHRCVIARDQQQGPGQCKQSAPLHPHTGMHRHKKLKELQTKVTLAAHCACLTPKERKSIGFHQKVPHCVKEDIMMPLQGSHPCCTFTLSLPLSFPLLKPPPDHLSSCKDWMDHDCSRALQHYWPYHWRQSCCLLTKG